jgi:hypothetical protein
MTIFRFDILLTRKYICKQDVLKIAAQKSISFPRYQSPKITEIVVYVTECECFLVL